jgi:hypothetical protein
MEIRKSDFYEDETELVKINSEDIELFAGLLLGKWFARCEQAGKVKDNIVAKCKAEKRDMTFHEHLDADVFYKECENMWFGLKGLTRVSIACKDAAHFSVALSNEKSKIANYIEKYLGFDPILDKKQFGF